jgi:molybdenum cofactor cytidylyltransferase
MATGGLILAAGAGARFAADGGGIKQLACFRGRPLLQWALDASCAVEELRHVVVVLGANAHAIIEAIDLGRAQPVVCIDWQAGVSASLRLGMRALADCERVIVTLGDQPLVDAATIRRFVAEPPGTRAAHAGLPGHPVVLGHAHRDALNRLKGDRGAASLLEGARLLEVGDGVVRDVDRLSDLPKLV